MSVLSGLWSLLGAGSVTGRRRADVAACAILQELALADGVLAPAEATAIRGAMRDLLGVPEEALADLEARAAQARSERPDLSEHARAVATQWSADEKLHVIDAIRRVIWADGKLAGHEKRIATSVASLLGVSTEEAAKVLQPPEA